MTFDYKTTVVARYTERDIYFRLFNHNNSIVIFGRDASQIFRICGDVEQNDIVELKKIIFVLGEESEYEDSAANMLNSSVLKTLKAFYQNKKVSIYNKNNKEVAECFRTHVKTDQTNIFDMMAKVKPFRLKI